MNERQRYVAGALGSLLVFLLALWLLHRTLHGIRLHDVLAELRLMPAGSLGVAMALTVAGYFVLTGYDVLAVRFVGHSLPYPRVALASFLGFAIGNTVGLAMLTGGSVRYRIYSAAGLSALEIASVVAFCTFTFGVGTVVIVGVALLADPVMAGRAIRISPAAAHAAGMAFMALACAYVAWTARHHGPVTLRGRVLRVPGPLTTMAQMALAGTDLAIAAGVLFVLLPAHAGVSYGAFLGVYVIAMVAGIASHVPGGLGVFETMLVLGLPGVPPPTLLGAALAYRGVYYLLPLGVAAALLGLHETVAQSGRLARLMAPVGDMLGRVTPQLLSALTLFAGAVLLFSAATPEERSRLAEMRRFVPLAVLECSHLLSSVCGLVLLAVARGLYRRLESAWRAGRVVLLAGMAFSLLKGLDYEQTLILGVVLLVLHGGRRAFYRRPSLLADRFAPGWLASIALVLCASIWLGFFSYKHVGYSDTLWWHFAYRADAPRFLRAMTVVLGVSLGTLVWQLLRPARPFSLRAGERDLARARAVIAASPRCEAQLVLAGDKQLLFNEACDAFLMYGVCGRSWVAMGDVVGPPAAAPELLWAFRELCDEHDGRPALFQVDSAGLPLYLDLGLAPLKIGEQALVALPHFTLQGPSRASLRETCVQVERAGAVFEVVAPAAVQALLPELEEVSNAWLAAAGTREKGFSSGRFSRSYLTNFPCALLRLRGRVVAFANLWAAARHEELSVDLIRFTDTAPGGAMDYLLAQVMGWGRERGYHWFNLGTAPLAGDEQRELAPVWRRAGASVYRHGEHFEGFASLRRYKERFEPLWQPRYLAAPGGIALPRVLLDVATLIAGDTPDTARG